LHVVGIFLRLGGGVDARWRTRRPTCGHREASDNWCVATSRGAAQQPVAGDGRRVGSRYAGALGVRPPRLNRGVRPKGAGVTLKRKANFPIAIVVSLACCGTSLANYSASFKEVAQM